MVTHFDYSSGGAALVVGRYDEPFHVSYPANAIRGYHQVGLRFIGNSYDNAIEGSQRFADILSGGDGNDSLNGLRGADRMIGGPGDDTLWVDDAGDRVIEFAREGNDTVISTVNHALAANVENLTLKGTADISGIGNAAANLLRGNAGDNRLDGGRGDDAMFGGAGDDIYWIDSAGDRVGEREGKGIDTVISTVSHALAANVENLRLAGAADINGIGNVLSNILRGNGGDNRLDGGLGADRMAGGAGDDSYRVDSRADRVIEAAGQGVDTVVSTVTHALPDNVENLTLLGSAAIDGSGNTLANRILGNIGPNLIRGGAGDDDLRGGPGDDILLGGPGRDTLSGGQGADRFVLDGPLASPAGPARDLIADFEQGADLIDFRGIDARTDLPGDQPLVFIGNRAFSGLGGELRQQGDLLSADIDGDGLADMEIRVAGHPALAAGDVLL